SLVIAFLVKVGHAAVKKGGVIVAVYFDRFCIIGDRQIVFAGNCVRSGTLLVIHIVRSGRRRDRFRRWNNGNLRRGGFFADRIEEAFIGAGRRKFFFDLGRKRKCH